VVSGVIHLPGGQRIMTCSYDGSLQVWDLQSRKRIGDSWRDEESGVNTIALSLDGKKVASGSNDGAVRLWDVDTEKVIAKWTGHKGRISSMCWNRGGRAVSGSYNDGTVRVWDVESGKTVLEIETGFSNVNTIIYSPDSTMIATGGHSREYLKIWDAKTGTLVANLKGHTQQVNCLAWTADRKTLISGSMDGSIRTWNTTTWQQIAVLTAHTGSNVYGIAISPNGRILASAALYDRTAQLWNLENDQPIGSPLQHKDSVNCMLFSTDGKLLVTGGNDSNAYVWNISAIVKQAGLGELLLNPHVS
jgi:WD40 repeat protein